MPQYKAELRKYAYTRTAIQDFDNYNVRKANNTAYNANKYYKPYIKQKIKANPNSISPSNYYAKLEYLRKRQENAIKYNQQFLEKTHNMNSHVQ